MKHETCDIKRSIICIASYLLLAVMTTFVISCGSAATEGEDYGNLMDSPDGLALTAHEHKYGWGKSDCTACHNFYNIHLHTISGIDMAAVRSQVASEGLSSCPTCHGDNGVNGPTCASCHGN